MQLKSIYFVLEPIAMCQNHTKSDLFPHMLLFIMTLMRLMSLLSLKKRRSPSLVPQSS